MSGERRQAPRKRFGQNFLTDPMVARRMGWQGRVVLCTCRKAN